MKALAAPDLAGIHAKERIIDQISNLQGGIARVLAGDERRLEVVKVDAGQRLCDVEFARFVVETCAVPVEHAVGGVGVLLDFKNNVPRADGVEASVRSLESKDEASIRAMVDSILEARLADGQLDDAELTLKNLSQINEAFVQQLLGMYHSRIQYPDNVLPLEPHREAGTGRHA